MNENRKSVQEVEVRALLNKFEYESIMKKLEAVDFNEEVNITDVYFCPNNVASFDEISMDKVDSYSLRLRKQIKNGSNKNTINTKIITQKGDHNSWEECETSVGSIDKLENILQAIGFKPFCRINKIRRIYEFENVEVMMEDIKDFGFGIEIEILTDKDKTESSKAKIFTIMKKLGINKSNIVPKSITKIIMKKQSKF